MLRSDELHVVVVSYFLTVPFLTKHGASARLSGFHDPRRNHVRPHGIICMVCIQGYYITGPMENARCLPADGRIYPSCPPANPRPAQPRRRTARGVPKRRADAESGRLAVRHDYRRTARGVPKRRTDAERGQRPRPPGRQPGPPVLQGRCWPALEARPAAPPGALKTGAEYQASQNNRPAFRRAG